MFNSSRSKKLYERKINNRDNNITSSVRKKIKCKVPTSARTYIDGNNRKQNQNNTPIDLKGNITINEISAENNRSKIKLSSLTTDNLNKLPSFQDRNTILEKNKNISKNSN